MQMSLLGLVSLVLYHGMEIDLQGTETNDATTSRCDGELGLRQQMLSRGTNDGKSLTRRANTAKCFEFSQRIGLRVLLKLIMFPEVEPRK